MNWIAIAIAGHLLNAVAFIVDKTLLSGSFKRSGTYAATIGLFSAFALVLAPWAGFPQQVATWFAIATFGVSFVIAMWGFFEALSKAETSRVVPVVGSLIPLFTLVLASVLVHERLTGRALLGLFILVAATLLLTRSGDKKHHLDGRSFWICVGSALLFAVSSAAGKFAFEREPFVDVFFWSRLFAAATAFIIPLFSKGVREELRGLIHPDRRRGGNVTGGVLLMVFGQACGALGFVGVQYAISQGSATVVNAMQTVQYATIVLVAWLGGKKLAAILKEDRTPAVLAQKGFAIVLVAVGLALVSIEPSGMPIRYGFTWSAPYARMLGLDPDAGLEQALHDLHPAHVRLLAYWSETEPQENRYDFSELDRQLDLAERYGASVTLAVGARLPRWPECWIPDWVNSLDMGARDQAQLDYVKAVYDHEAGRASVIGWQVENEPVLNSFQSCPGLSRDLVSSEIRLVQANERARGTLRPVSTTDSGELSLWLHFAGETDALGVSVYRIVTHPFIGTIRWLLPADFYADKAAVLKPWIGNVYVSEFQMEPWADQPLTQTPIETQTAQFSLDQMRKNFRYAERIELPAVDFWGVEWWLWMKDKQNQPGYWDEAKTFFASHRD
ncbi:MAG TPA: DMT family transporter [Verrucomicrobiae bacterium]|nr:DMT family transporter [Verrucomicrobiae bacterium]